MGIEKQKKLLFVEYLSPSLLIFPTIHNPVIAQ